MIELKHLPSLRATDGSPVHLRLPSKAIYGILGPYGSGKSRLCSLLAGVLQDSTGTVKINGFDTVTDARRARGAVGFLPAHAPLWEDMTPVELLEFLASARGLSYEKAMRQIHELLELGELEAQREKLIKSLSLPKRRTLAVLQTAIGGTETLVLDEPFAGLSAEGVRDLSALIVELGHTHTVFVASERPELLLPLCNRILVLDDGALALDVSPEEFPTERYAAICARAKTVAPTAKPSAPKKEGKYELIDEESEDDA